MPVTGLRWILRRRVDHSSLRRPGSSKLFKASRSEGNVYTIIYPIMNLKGTKTERNLQEAFAGESMARNKYTYYASKAKKDGYVQISKIFEETTRVSVALSSTGSVFSMSTAWV